MPFGSPDRTPNGNTIIFDRGFNHEPQLNDQRLAPARKLSGQEVKHHRIASSGILRGECNEFRAQCLWREFSLAVGQPHSSQWRLLFRHKRRAWPSLKLTKSLRRYLFETVLITGTLIRGTAAVVPVTNLSSQDFAMTAPS